MAGDSLRRHHTSRGGAALLGLVFLFAAVSAPAVDLEAPPEGLVARDVALRAEGVLRSERTMFEAKMTIRSKRRSKPRVVRFRRYDDRPAKRSFIRILAPENDEDTTFLKLHPNLWKYDADGDHTVRVPDSMMLQPWMDSDFTNDDVVDRSSKIDDYDHRLLGVGRGPERQ